jgi:hypothetical protein
MPFPSRRLTPLPDATPSSSVAEMVESRDRRRFRPREGLELANATGDISVRRMVGGAVVVVVVVEEGSLRCLGFGVVARRGSEW